MKHIAIALAALTLAACQPVTPNDYSGPGSATYNRAQAAAAAARADAEREAALTGQAATTAVTSDPQPLTVNATPVAVDASPSNPAPLQVGVAQTPARAANTASISDEQSFDAVAGRESIESDAARLEVNRQQYQVIQPTDLPTRPGALPNIVDYALRTNNPVGVQLYRRIGINLQNRSIRNCASYASSDLAQQDFLARGGPSRDRRALDPDGDGYACRWNPAPFRLAAGAAQTATPAPAPVIATQ